mmetsp:Transcript_39860/g.59125  ORF Transcript_39860/g.59125 Transcript_39860/m.59125 type:complete len:110 (-) Transcript_39860:1535-1864(-)
MSNSSSATRPIGMHHTAGTSRTVETICKCRQKPSSVERYVCSSHIHKCQDDPPSSCIVFVLGEGYMGRSGFPGFPIAVSLTSTATTVGAPFDFPVMMHERPSPRNQKHP